MSSQNNNITQDLRATSTIFKIVLSGGNIK